MRRPPLSAQEMTLSVKLFSTLFKRLIGADFAILLSLGEFYVFVNLLQPKFLEKRGYFFVFTGFGFASVIFVFGALISFERPDLIRAALFFGIRLFFAALSVAAKVLLIIAFEGFFFVFLIKSFNACLTALFRSPRFLSFRNFLIADFVTGMQVF